MALYLGLLLFSFIITSIAIVPYIDLLYRLRLTSKLTTPVGGGILIIGLVSILFAALFTLVRRFGVYINLGFPLREELNLIFFTFISFGLLGFYDDLVKIFNLRARNHYQGLIQLVLAIIISLLLFQNLHIQILNLPILGVINLGWLYIPVAVVVIMTFTRGFAISDSFDGLACGTLLIALLAFWSVSVSHLDTPLSVFIALWVGALIAFLYFNVYPARIRLGRSGSLSFGATLAVVGLLLGKTVALFIIGGIFVSEVLFNLIQTIGQSLFHRQIFPHTPFHHWLQAHGWPEPKIVLRLWLVAFLLAIAGLWLSGL